MDTIVGKVGYQVFRSADGRFSVLNIKQQGGGNVRVSGMDLPTNMKINYSFTGEYRKHPRYGMGFNVTSYEAVKPDKKESIIEYLASGIFKGIGDKVAERIYERFGDESADIIENDPDKLLCIRGITQAKIDEIKEQSKKTKYIQELNKELSKYGIAPDQCVRIAKHYGFRALDRIKANPYILIKDIRYPFVSADALAMGMGIAPDDERRMDAAFRQIFSTAYASGDTGMELQAFGQNVYRLLNASVSPEEINGAVIKRITKRQIVHVVYETPAGRKTYLFTSSMADIERITAESLVRQNQRKVKKIEDLHHKLLKKEAELGILLDHLQERAVETGLGNPISIVTGGPGTGKSLIMKVVADLYEEEVGNDIILLAPTGRAARELYDYTGREASTINSFLGLHEVDNDEEESDMDDITNCLLIVDEFSMTDSRLARLLFSKLGDDTTVLIVGDIDQLPSVGPGAVLRDMIGSGIIPVTRLMTIFRMANGTDIAEVVGRVNAGDADVEMCNGFTMYYEEDMQRSKDLLTRLYLERVRQYGILNVMLLLPYRKYLGGVEDMNRHLQQTVNPPAEDKAEIRYGSMTIRRGDIVMHLKNTDDASNGDIGIVTDIMNETVFVKYTFRHRVKRVEYKGEDIGMLELAYAMTVHKSQGAEAEAVITMLNHYHRAMLYRAIPYVALSRAKRNIDLVCDDGFEDAVHTVRTNDRVTLLPYFLAYLTGQFIPV